MPTIASLFAPQGALASVLEGFQPRAGQLELAQAVADNLEKKGILLAEAGTGTGKTFAYLLPLFLSGQKALVSTATKNLQEQIYTSDLPLVRKVLEHPAKVALLKGRRNYFCHHHYTRLQEKPPKDAVEKQYRVRIDRFADSTKDGDLVHLHGVPEDHELISAITSTADNCLGRDCAFFEDCFVQKARQKAKEADVVVVNHHLLLADFALKSDGFAEILPDIETFIIDEAHHLPQTAINFLGERVSHRQITLLLDDLEVAIAEEAPDALDLKQTIAPVRQTLSKIQNLLAGSRESQLDEAAIEALDGFWALMSTLNGQLQNTQSELAPHRERGKQMSNLAGRIHDQLAVLSLFLPSDPNEDEALQPAVPEVAETESGVTQNAQPARAQWLDVSSKQFVLHSVPVNAAGRFAHWVRQSEASWSFLSATLAVGGDFEHFCRELGLSEVDTLQLESPFDYRMQSLLYHPPGLPDPNHANYTERLIAEVLPVLERSDGRAFLLFTSYRALYAAEAALKNSQFTLLVQGRAPKGQLLADFRRHDKAVLLATASFWEGVDVRGDRLVCVVIDKLPFPSPGDPLTKARHQLLASKGLTPFIHDTLPQAVISLKQGVGRLIRDSEDYGVLVIGDPRLSTRGYGKIFLESLPRMTRTTKLDVVNRFFDYHEQTKS